MSKLGWGILVVVAAAGCAQRTELVVGIATDLRARGQVDSVQFVASRQGTPIVSHTWSLSDVPAGDYELPGSFGLYSQTGGSPQISLDVIGFLGTTPVVERTSIVSLVDSETLFMRLGLVDDCSSVDGPTCADGQVCIEGVCRAPAVSAARLPSYTPPLVKSVACDSGTAFAVSSTGVLMPALHASCPAGQFCQEGTCLKFLAGEATSPAPSVWVDTNPPTTTVMRAVWTSADGHDVFAVGDAGTILHLTGAGATAASSWVSEPSGTSATLYGVWGASASDVFAVGSGGVMLHRDATGWSSNAPTPSPSIERLDAVWGSAHGDVWAVGRAPGQTAVALHYDGASWTALPPTAGIGELRGVWGASASDVWAVGPGGVAAHWDGGTWTAATGIAATDDLFAVGGSATNDVYAVGRAGVVYHCTGGTTFVAVPSTVTTDLFGVLVGSPTSVYAVGDYGVILFGNGTRFAAQPSGTQLPLFGVAGALKDVYVGGRHGQVLHKNGIGSGRCTAPSDCESGFCVDGFCCDQACGGSCQACDVAGVEGSCTTIAQNDTPHGTRAACLGAGSPPCGGFCDGKAGTACNYPTVTCGAAACSPADDYTLLQAPVCSNGACASPVPKTCEPFGCSNGACDPSPCPYVPSNPPTTTNPVNAGCASTHPVCESTGQCLENLAQPCSQDAQCDSGNCLSGICCECGANECTGSFTLTTGNTCLPSGQCNTSKTTVDCSTPGHFACDFSTNACYTSCTPVGASGEVSGCWPTTDVCSGPGGTCAPPPS